MYLEMGDLSTLEYLYDLRWISASSEMHSAAAVLLSVGMIAILVKKRHKKAHGVPSADDAQVLRGDRGSWRKRAKRGNLC